MDLVDTLRNKVEALGEQEFVPGLRSVPLHIVTAFRHPSRGQEAVDQLKSARERGLLDLTVQILLNFSAHSCLANKSVPTARETQILGGITGYISSAAGDLSLSTYDEAVQSGADLLISDHKSTVALEVSMASPLVHRKIESFVRYFLSAVRKSPGVEPGILLIWSNEPLVQTELNLPTARERISVLAPERLRIPTYLLAPTRITDIPEPIAMV